MNPLTKSAKTSQGSHAPQHSFGSVEQARELFSSVMLATDVYKKSKTMSLEEFKAQQYPLTVSDASTLVARMIRDVEQHQNFEKIQYLVEAYQVPPEGAFAYAATECTMPSFIQWFAGRVPDTTTERLEHVLAAIACDNVDLLRQINRPWSKRLTKALLMFAAESKAEFCFTLLQPKDFGASAFIKCTTINEFKGVFELLQGRTIPLSMLRRIWKQYQTRSMNLYREPFLRKTMVKMKKIRSKHNGMNGPRGEDEKRNFVEFLWPLVCQRGRTWLAKQPCMKNHPLELQRDLMKKTFHSKPTIQSHQRKL